MKYTALCLLSILATLPAPVAAQCQLLTPPAPILGEAQGGHMARDGDLLLVSSTTPAMPDVHVFRRDYDQWRHEATLSPPPDVSIGDDFGQALALDGDLAAVGARGRFAELGSVFLFRRTEDPLTGVGSWALEDEVVSENLVVNESFGSTVDLEGDFLAVGAPTNDYIDPNAGIVEVFDLSSGSAVSMGVLVPQGVVQDGLFGTSIAMSGTRMLVGASGEGTGASTGRGYVSVYGYNGSAWVFVDRFTSANASAKGFGAEVVWAAAAPIPTVFVSAPFTFVNSVSSAGEVYRLVEQPIVGGFVWIQTDTLQSPEPLASAHFGRSLSVYKPFFGPTRIAVNDGQINQDATAKVRVFESQDDDWVVTRTISGPPPRPRTFGESLFIDGRELLVGHPFHEIDVQLQGAVAVYAHGDCPDTRRLAPPGLSAGDRLGSSVAAGPGLALFGLPGADGGASDGGEVWSFAAGPEGWERDQILVDLTPADGDGFGASVALSPDGSLAFVGAPLDDGNGPDTGRVHVYERSGASWTAIQELPCPGPRTDGRFGTALASVGRWLVVGEPGPDAAAGRAFVFEDLGGVLVEHSTLVPDDPFVGGDFGVALSAAPGRIAVGDPRDAQAGVDAGAAYVFRRDGTMDAWLPEHKVPGAAAGDAFASSLALVGMNLVVGAPEAEVAGVVGAGAAYVFRFDGTALNLADLRTENTPREDAHFGIAVAGDGPRITVGADAAGNGDPGRVRPFLEVGSTLFPGRSVAPLDASTSALFGSSLAVRDGLVFAGAPGDDREGTDSGSAWMFALEAGPDGAFLRRR